MFKKLILMIAIFAVCSYGQNRVESQPRSYDWIKIASGVVGSSSDTTDAFTINQRWGALTLWIQPTAVATPGNVEVKIQLYNRRTQTWGWFYSATDTLVATVPESRLSTTIGVYVLPSAETTVLWGWADQARFIIEPASASVTYDAYVGGN